MIALLHNNKSSPQSLLLVHNFCYTSITPNQSLKSHFMATSSIKNCLHNPKTRLECCNPYNTQTHSSHNILQWKYICLLYSLFTLMNVKIGTQLAVRASDIIFRQNPFSTQADITYLISIQFIYHMCRMNNNWPVSSQVNIPILFNRHMAPCHIIIRVYNR
jgi:hypothetical protein